MDTVKSKSSNVTGLVHKFSKVLRFRATGISPDDSIRNPKLPEKDEDLTHKVFKNSQSFNGDDEKVINREAMEALIAKLFANVSAIKAAYAQLQIAQTPYDPDTIQSADEVVVSELKNLSELKQCYLKKQIIPSQNSQMVAEIEEQQNLLKTFDILSKKLQSQLELKDSELIFLREKFFESDRQNKTLEKRLNPNNCLSAFDNLHLSALNPNHFITVLRHTLKSIRAFVKLMISGMESAGWDIDSASGSIEPDVKFTKPAHRFFAFESYVCRKMFGDFQNPYFSIPKENSSKQRHHQRQFFESFMGFKSIKPTEFLLQNPKSLFGNFCRLKYLSLVHPKMESSFFGDLNQRTLLNSGEFPASSFFAEFVEMAKRVWLLHCLGFSFEPEALIFQVRKGCRFSEVYMESVVEDGFFFPSGDSSPEIFKPKVGFTVIPGFKVGKTIVQCTVYISPA
ncbi:protein GRAVITROPIC IN THE LIGHT 1-like [Tasmannia lanceolata]|uniref:protein GRAVITROPIC IN THE LIGHT 1-like n=1 Tax=Tasmannia lanceolata TaxID=3420 RepID=UPI004064C420